MKYKAINYNFADEGFLDANTLQTISTSKVHSGSNGIFINQKLCSQKALLKAQERMLKIFLHTKFNIPPDTKPSLNENNLDKDYPIKFKKSEYLDAQIDFESLIKKAFIVAIDNRKKNTCKIILRLTGNDLPHLIRSTKTNYKPNF